MTVPSLRAQIDRDFWLEGFRDFLALESGHSANTVESYLRDLRRLGEFATARGVRDPGRLTRSLLRDFVYLLKDLGLSAASIRRGVSICGAKNVSLSIRRLPLHATPIYLVIFADGFLRRPVAFGFRSTP